MKTKITLLITFLMCIIETNSYGQNLKSQKMDNNKEIIKEFYKALNAEHSKEVETILQKTVIKDWKSYENNNDYRKGGTEIFINILKAFHQKIPNLKNGK